VYLADWPEASFVLQHAGAAVISLDDVNGDEKVIEEMASSCRVLAVTEGNQGSRVFWSGDVRRFRAPHVEDVDSVGAGDIYAAAFFIRLYSTRDPWEAGRFATLLAACSVTRPYFSGIPTAEEIQSVSIEVF
jgi:sugar/nucleoside kinase (ribokinase family)